MKKITIVLLLLLVTVGVFGEEKDKKNPFGLTTSVGVSTIIAQGVFIDIGLGNQQEDYYFLCNFFFD